jgi:hypothetical protein
MGYLVVAFGLSGALLANGFVLIATGLVVLLAMPRLRKL